MQTAEAVLSEIRGSFAAADAQAKLSIFRRAVDLCVATMPTASQETSRLFDIVIAQMLQFMDFDTLLELSEALSTLDRAPRGLLNTLAESSYSIAKPILERSSAIEEAVLVRIADRGDDSALFSMAKRLSISIRLSDILVTKGGRATILTLAKNAGAKLSDFGIELLVNKSEHDTTLQMILTRRSDLPDGATRRLAVLIDMRVANAFARDPATRETSEHSLILHGSGASPLLDELRAHVAATKRRCPT